MKILADLWQEAVKWRRYERRVDFLKFMAAYLRYDTPVYRKAKVMMQESVEHLGKAYALSLTADDLAAEGIRGSALDELHEHMIDHLQAAERLRVGSRTLTEVLPKIFSDAAAELRVLNVIVYDFDTITISKYEVQAR